MKLNFKLEEKVRKNQLFLKITYMSGDADAYDHEEILLRNEYVLGGELNESEKEKIQNYAELAKILDCNSERYLEDYEDVLNEYGEDIAHLYDCAKNDSTTDFSMKAAISEIELIAYNEDGDKYYHSII